MKAFSAHCASSLREPKAQIKNLISFLKHFYPSVLEIGTEILLAEVSQWKLFHVRDEEILGYTISHTFFPLHACVVGSFYKANNIKSNCL